jgi:hypothetical protein
MMKHPTVAGGFFWVFADEGIARADQGGRIDNAGNYAPDGIVGPRGEREGSFYTVKEIWSPVRMTLDRTNSPTRFAVELHNDFAFTNLKACTFRWRQVRLPKPSENGEPVIVQEGSLAGPDVRPGTTGRFTIRTKKSGDHEHRVYVTALAPDGRELLTVSKAMAPREITPMPKPAPGGNRPAEQISPASFSPGKTKRGSRQTPAVTESAETIVMQTASAKYTFSKATGRLVGAALGERDWSFLTGPSLLALKRQDRTFAPVGPGQSLVSLRHGTSPVIGTAWIEAWFKNPEMRLLWSVNHDDRVVMAYDLTVDGEFDVLGLRFDLPDDRLKSKRWVGQGPYRVWRNRMEGGQYGVHEVRFNDSAPGEAYQYPEFKGYFRDWGWFELTTSAGRLIMEPSVAASLPPFLGLGKPRDGVNGLLDLPDVGLSFLEIIPAMRNKFHTTDQLGPQSLTPHAKGSTSGAVIFRFAAP